MEGNDELEQLKSESAAMVQYLKSLGKEEKDLQIQNEILAREALNNGWTPENMGAAAPKKKRPAASKKQENKT